MRTRPNGYQSSSQSWLLSAVGSSSTRFVSHKHLCSLLPSCSALLWCRLGDDVDRRSATKSLEVTHHQCQEFGIFLLDQHWILGLVYLRHCDLSMLGLMSALNSFSNTLNRLTLISQHIETRYSCFNHI